MRASDRSLYVDAIVGDLGSRTVVVITEIQKDHLDGLKAQFTRPPRALMKYDSKPYEKYIKPVTHESCLAMPTNASKVWSILK